ncbi:MAG: rhodanese-like domain-containing protein [Candidatus Binatia bacterium]
MPKTIIEREELQQRVKDGAQLVEVLSANEFAWAHLPEAVNIPLAKLTAKTIAWLDKKKTTIVYCYDYQ